MSRIDPTAIVYGNVELGLNSVVEPFAILGIQDRFHPPSMVVIGSDAFIGSRCTIYAGVIAGDWLDLSDQTTLFTDNTFGHHVRIGPKAVIKNGCRVGNNVRINAQTFLERVEIEDFVFVGPGTVFTDDKHPPCPRYADCVPRSHVESYVSIGANVTLAPGIRIGHHVQIYGGAVVTRDVEANSVVGGNPARFLKRFDELECAPQLFKTPFEWWEQK
ncbi:MAG: DapH/DapD/GlmU-related protein [Acidobacteriota bacterium]